MQINVTQLWPSPTTLYNLEVTSEANANSDSVFYIPIPRWADLSQLENQIYHLTRYSQRSFDAIILRAHRIEAEFLLGGSDEARLLIDHLSFRVESRPIWVLRWLDDRYYLTRLRPQGMSEDDNLAHLSPLEGWQLNEDFVEYLTWGLRQAEMMSWTVQRGAQLPKTSACHFVGPNKSHYASFLRVGVITRSVDVLDAIAFWLLPLLVRNRNGNFLILLDSWTILSVGLNSQRYIEECGYVSSRGTIECLHDYDEDSDDLLRRLNRLEEATGEFAEILLVVSVSSSNRLARRLIALCKSGNWKVNLISLFSSNPSVLFSEDDKLVHVRRDIADSHNDNEEIDIENSFLCSLGPDFLRHDAKSCPICDNGNKSLIAIEPSTYLLETTAATDISAISNNYVGESVAFFGRYAGSGCVSVHKSQDNGNRHHMIFVDVKKLLETREFRERVEEIVLSCKESFDVILAPNHEAAVLLSILVSQISEKPLVICDQQNLGKLPNVEKENLIGKRVLLVDDVVVSGSTLRSYRSYLRRERFLAEGFQLHFLVAVARPTSEAIFAGIKDMIHPRSNFHWVEKILLPNWHERQCPWCRERELIETAMENVEAIGASVGLKQRYERLVDTNLGLQNNLFLFWSSPEECENLLKLGPGSIFEGREPEPLTQVELFVSVANAIQVMRSKGLLNENFTTPIAKILDPDKSLMLRYYDRVIPACILRATKNHDLLAPNVDTRLIEIVNEMLVDQSALELIGEVLLAVAAGKLPSASDLNGDVLSWALDNGEAGACGLLRSLVFPDTS